MTRRSLAVRRILTGLATTTVTGMMLVGCVTIPPTRPVAGGVTVPDSLLADDPLFRASRAMVRFRTEMCDGVYTGSGFAIDAHHIITNRHVVGGASLVQAETWDGTELDVTDVQITADDDLALVEVEQELTHTIELATHDPEDNASITVVGYPLGNALRLDPGTTLDIRDGDRYGSDEVVMIDARVQHGNSGGPIVDAEGRVVGVVFLYLTTEKNRGVAISVEALRRVLDGDDLVPNPSCERYVDEYGAP